MFSHICKVPFARYGSVFQNVQNFQGLALARVHFFLAGGSIRGSAGKESTCNDGDLGLIPVLGSPLKKGKASISMLTV